MVTPDDPSEALGALGGGQGRLEALRALQRLLAVSLHEAPADKRAPLAQQLRGVLAEIDQLKQPEEGDPVVSLVDRFAARRAAAGSDSA